MSTLQAKSALLEWYEHHRRELPWRANRDPYRIWIAETMLQQTTTTAVIPYFERFLQRFPRLATLASAEESAVLEAWAGLGYYSRARNLHRAAILLQARGAFPQDYLQLAELPGFGPYTSRAVASLAFDQAVGVVDGNVIRVLSRFEGADWEWWKSKVRGLIQARADLWVDQVSSYAMNQALMELGRTICTPKVPRCLLCPLHRQCISLRDNKVPSRPRGKAKPLRESWMWQPQILIRGKKILLRRNVTAPFLRGQWLLPGVARRLKSKPRTFHYRHTITHHDIYVTVSLANPKLEPTDKWVPLKEIRQYVPASLVHKALAYL